jgi:hypothetical protein
MRYKTWLAAVRLLPFLLLTLIPTQLKAQTSWVNTTCTRREERTFARYYVTGDQVFVRNAARKFALGTLFKRDNKNNADRFDVQYISPKGWAWGYGHGNYKGFGWVKLWEREVPAGASNSSKGDIYLRATGFTAPARYPCHREIPPSDFSFAKNSVTRRNGRESQGDGSPARITGSGVKIFGTYRDKNGLYRYVADRDGHTFDERGFGPLDQTRRVLWRYITRDRQYVLLRTNDVGSGGRRIEDRWGFVPRCNVIIPGREAERMAQCGDP